MWSCRVPQLSLGILRVGASPAATALRRQSGLEVAYPQGPWVLMPVGVPGGCGSSWWLLTAWCGGTPAGPLEPGLTQ